MVVFEPDEIDDIVTTEVGGSALFASRFRECAARALLLPRRDPGRRSPAVAAAPALRGAARGRLQVPVVPDRARGGPRVPPGRLRPARAGRADEGGRPARGPGRRRRHARALARTPAACSSATSPSSSTRATPPSPSAAPPRCPSTRACSPSCSAGPSCASCSTPRCWPRSRPSSSGWPPSGGPAAPRAWPTCCGCSGRSPPTRCRRAAPTGVDAREALADARHPPGRPGPGGRGRLAGPRSRTSAGSATASASPCRPGTPDAFTDPVEDPLADLVSRYARTHGPFTTDQAAARLGLGAAVVRHTLQRLAAQGRVLDGEFRPSGSGLGVVRRRGAPLAAAPVAGPAAQGGRAGPAARRSAGSCPPGSTCRRARPPGAPRGRRRAVRDRPAGRGPGARERPRVAGAARPGPRLRAVLPRRAHRRRRGALGRPRARCPGADGWVSLHLADQARADPARARALRALGAAPDRSSTPSRPAARGSSASSPTRWARPTTGALSAALWELVWAGRISNDTLTPLRALTRGGRATHRTKAAAAAAADGLDDRRRGGVPARTGPPETAGRWALLPDPRHRPDPAGARRRPSGCSTGTAW